MTMMMMTMTMMMMVIDNGGNDEDSCKWDQTIESTPFADSMNDSADSSLLMTKNDD